MKTAKCKPWICVEQDCKKCASFVDECPQECPVQVLHALDRSDTGWLEKPRRSGKTFKLVECAGKLIESGQDVVVITRDKDMREYVERMGKKFGLTLFTLTLSTYKQALQGVERCWILTDELTQGETQDIQHDMLGHTFLLGYYTEPAPEWTKDP